MEISKAILALISIAINLRARAAKAEEVQAEQAARIADMTQTIADMRAKLDGIAPQTVDVPADVAQALTAAAGQ